MANISEAQQRILDGIDMSEDGAYDIPSYSTMKHTSARVLETLGLVTVVRMPAGAIRVRRKGHEAPPDPIGTHEALLQHDIEDAEARVRGARENLTEAVNAAAKAHQRLNDYRYEKRMSHRG